MNPTTRLLLLCLAIGLMLPGNLIAQDGTIEQTVSPTKMGRWVIKTTHGATAEFVEGPETPLRGKGSLRVSTGPGDGPGKGGKIYIGNDLWNDKVLSDIGELSFSFYVETASSTGVAPYLNVHLDYNLNGKWDGVEGGDMILVFDPTLQPQPGANHPIPAKTWKTGLMEADTHVANHNHGEWWIVGHEDIAGRKGNSKNLAKILGSFPARQMIPNSIDGIPAVVLVVGAKDGGSFANFQGYIDNVTMKENHRRPICYDFEFTASPPPPELAKSGATPAPKKEPLKKTPLESKKPAPTPPPEPLPEEDEALEDHTGTYHTDSQPNPALLASVSVSLLGGLVWLVYLIVQVVRCRKIVG